MLKWIIDSVHLHVLREIEENEENRILSMIIGGCKSKSSKILKWYCEYLPIIWELLELLNRDMDSFFSPKVTKLKLCLHQNYMDIQGR